MKTSYPSSLYFLRLEAVANHSLYLDSLNSNSSLLLPLLPIAIIGYNYAEKYYVNLENKLKVAPFLSNDQDEHIKMNSSFLAKSIFLYEQYNDSIEDCSMLSSYFTLITASNDENIKTHLAYFLAIKNYKEASEKLIKEFYNAKTNEYKIALSKALSTIYNKDVLNELLEMAENKEFKNVNFPIISTLNKYKDKRVKKFLKE